MKKKSVVLLTVLGLLMALPGWAALTKLTEVTLTDSEDPFSRRIYSYDFDVTSDGMVHAVYSKPVVGEDRAQIIYAAKSVGGAWPPESQRTVLEEFGYVSSISTYIINAPRTDIIHICYLVERDFIDQNGITHSHGLVYQTIKNGVVGSKINISPGAFHTRMQLDEDGCAIFAREYEIFVTDDGVLLNPPFPKALRIQVPDKTRADYWTDRDYVFQLPSPVSAAEDYRLAQFVYDIDHGRYHLVYGDKDAVALQNAYPTTNPPVTPDKNPVPFPAGAGHKLWYAYSDDLENWTTSLIDPSGDISENEFWTDFVLNDQGTPFVASYRYKTDFQGVQEGCTNIIGKFTSGAWQIQTVAGKTTGASPSRAGMGGGLVIDASGGLHGVWDNSPDKPIDAESGGVGAGTTMYRYSPDGESWDVRQPLLPYSAEGQCRMKLYDDKLLLMLLGDGQDARLIFSEFQIPTSTDHLFEISTDKMFYGMGETIKLHVRLQGDGSAQGDLYIVAAGPYNMNGAGQLQPIISTQFYYLGPDVSWHVMGPSLQMQPILSHFPLIDVNVDFLTSLAGSMVPFNNPARYVIYSVANDPEQPLGAFVTPLNSYMLHVCSQPGCGEL